MRTFFTLFIMGALMAFAKNDLPEHKIVDESRIYTGTRIQINSDNKNLTKKQCIALIDAYRSKVLPGGQISVHKPSTLKDLKSAIILPYCVDNFNGKGIIFNTYFHPDSK